ncbi:MAG TPA: LCP family protein [Acidimicrobiales bacterium]|nr:LCP family protein [Acidimicrobiales bacterium]
MERRKLARRVRRRRRTRNSLLAAGAAILVMVGSAAGYAYYVARGIHRIHVKGLHSALTSGREAGSENILMVGSTSRCALAVQSTAYGLCSEGVNGVNSDVIMILHADPATHQLALLSIPRDLFVPNARSTGPNKIDAGLYQGISQVVASIQEDFGIPIQHAVSLNFDQFANVVDAIGGINMSFPESVYDAESGLNVHAAACVHLNGTQALQVVRARHLQYQGDSSTPYAPYWTQESESDLARIRRDHEFLRVLASTIAARGIGNPVTDLSLISSLKSDLTFDQSWAVTDMVNLVLAFHKVDIDSVPQLTLPVSLVDDPDGPSGQLVYDGSTYGDVEFTSQSQDLAAIDQVLGISPSTDSMTGDPLPSPTSVSVAVENGTGAYDQATDTGSALSALGFHVVHLGDSSPVGDVAETVVYYGSLAPSAEAAAEAVAHDMTGSVVMAYDPAAVVDGAQVTVVTGSQFGFVSPTTSTATTSVPSTTSSSAGPPTTSSSTTTSTTSPFESSTAGDIGSPSPENTQLEPWDPRACAPGAVPTAPVPNPT